MLYTDCALEKIYVNTESFIDEEGNPLSCWDVLERILREYNVKIKQVKGKYLIVNYHELNSPVFHYDFATLTLGSRTMASNILDVTSYKYSDTIEQQKVKPLKGIKSTLHTGLMGTVQVEDSDWSFWDKHFFGVTVYSLTEAEFFSNSPFTENYITLYSKFTITKVTTYDYLRIVFDHYLKSVDGIGGTPTMDLKIELQFPNGSWSGPYYVRLLNWWTHFESPIVDFFKVEQSGDYNIKITLVADPSSSVTAWNTAYVDIKNVAINYSIDPENKLNLASSIYDKLYYQFSNKGVKILEEDIYFTDYCLPIEWGAMMENVNEVYETTTARWNSYLNGEQLKLVDMYSQNILNNRATYKNYLRCKIYDRQNNISFGTILLIEGKYYIFVKYDKDFQMGEIDCALIELVTTRLTYSWISETKINK